MTETLEAPIHLTTDEEAAYESSDGRTSASKAKVRKKSKGSKSLPG